MRIGTEQARHAAERGDLLRVLKEDYQQGMTSARNLLGTLDALGIPLSEQDLAFHLMYLADQGYLRIVRVKDTPAYRNDRRMLGWEKPETIKFLTLQPKGLQLLDGMIPEDPMVKF
jgi:hypothetical protein